MTVDEFKNKHPELAHLEGNALWDAMEDSLLNEHQNDEPKVVKDWKGNIVKEGDEICFIQIIKKDCFGDLYIGLPPHRELIKIKETNPDEFCWEKGEYHKVTLLEGHPAFTTTTYGYTFTRCLSLSMMDMNNIILAIRGVSDKPDAINSQK